jgi:OPT family oligopeptide transporter
MALFQKAPTTPEEMERHKPLELSPEEVLKLDEEQWYAQAYRGDATPQLTLRAIIMGAGLGFFLALTNLYIGLKAGWHLGVAVTACILSFGLWSTFVKIGAAKTPMTILENNCMQSTASAAGYATGGTMVSAIPALLMLSASPENPGGTHLPWPVLALWTFFLAVLGTVLAIPMKRNMINQEKLRFPSGTAAAVTLQSLYSEGKQALAKARALLYAALIAGVVPLLTTLNVVKDVTAAGAVVRKALIPSVIPIFNFLPGIAGGGKKFALSDWNIQLDWTPALIAAGALVGLRVTISMLVGGLVLAAVLGPMGMEWAWVNPKGIEVVAVTRPQAVHSQIGLWAGAPIMVASGLLSFAFQWRTIGRAFASFGRKSPGAGAGEAADAAAQHVARTEVPGSWFLWGAVFSGAGVIAIAWLFFQVPPYFGVLAVLLTFALALVACRATGESDVTPTGAMGKIMQLIVGVLIPQNATANLMTAGITAGAASASADLLNDLKSGYLLGANPRRQFMAQFLGIVPGTIATVIGFYVLVPNATTLTGEGGVAPAFGVPAAQAWKAVAQVFQDGIGNLHPMARQCILWGVVVGVVLTLVERLLSGEKYKSYKKYFPSATGIGLGMILPFYQPLQMFLGAAIATIVASGKDNKAGEYVIPVASGLIAGESLIGVVVAILNNFVLK